MSGTLGTGIAPGFGGFAATPAGQLQYWNRQHNPYAFLQQQPDFVGDTAPAAAQTLARGGTVLRLEEGGDATDSSNDGGFGAGGFGNADGGFDAGFGGPGTATDPAAPGSQNSTDAFDAPGFGPHPDGNGFMTNQGFVAPDQPPVGPMNPDDPTIGQLGVAGAKGLAGGMVGMAGVPGLGTVANAAMSRAAGPDNFGFGQMSEGAKFGSGVMGALGGALGGPAGAAAGAMAGAVMGAHGENGPGAISGSNDAGLASGAHGTAQGTDPVAASTDIASLIRRIREALTTSANTPGMAGGGAVPGLMGAPGMGMPSMGGRMPNHAFHRGSGLVHGTSDGRSDALHMHVPSGGYVIPSDAVSGLGEGNTASGARKLSGLLPRSVPAMASGGSVPVRLSPGEFFLHPAHVAALGGGNLKHGSDKLDEMVGHIRRSNQRQVAALPPPR